MPLYRKRECHSFFGRHRCYRFQRELTFVCMYVCNVSAPGLPITREQVIKWAEQLMSTIDGIIDNINNIEGIAPALRAIGVRAAIVGAQPVHFELLESCLLELVQEVNEAEWTGRFEAAWTCGMEAIVAKIKPAMEQANRESAVIVKVGCSPTKQLYTAFLLW